MIGISARARQWLKFKLKNILVFKREWFYRRRRPLDDWCCKLSQTPGPIQPWVSASIRRIPNTLWKNEITLSSLKNMIFVISFSLLCKTILLSSIWSLQKYPTSYIYGFQGQEQHRVADFIHRCPFQNSSSFDFVWPCNNISPFGLGLSRVALVG